MTSASGLRGPTPATVADHFVATFGQGRLYVTVVAFGNELPQDSTFGSDNIEHLVPWLLLQQAKISSGKVASIAMIVRVFDEVATVEVLGPNGRVRIPEKDVFMFRYDASGMTGLSEVEAWRAHSTDHDTGALLAPEPAVRCRSGAEIVEALRGRA